MDRKMLDRALPFVYVVLLVASALFFRVLLAPLAIFGALAVAGWFSFLRPAIRARERAADDRDGSGLRPGDE